MDQAIERSKVPEVTLVFWIIKILATTLGETGGDAVSMSMDLGYAVSSLIFGGIFVVAVVAQISAKKFHPFLYWLVVIATTTAGTTMADLADRSLGVGYPGGALLLFVLLMASLAVWYWSAGSISVNTVSTPEIETFYWVSILFSQTLGTALGDWMADTNGPRLRRWRAGILRRPRADCGGLFLYRHLENPAVLGRLHPDATARRHAGGPSRQAAGQRRSGVQPVLRIRDPCGRHHCVCGIAPPARRYAPGKAPRCDLMS